jgi:hypothetical protein
MMMIDKILARHAALDRVEPGDIVVCDVDMAIRLDLEFSIAGMDLEPQRIADPERIAVILDLAVPAPTIGAAAGQARARAFAKKFGIAHFYDVGNHGSPDAKIYMGSSATVAASAVAGRIVDSDSLPPRGGHRMMVEGGAWLFDEPNINTDLIMPVTAFRLPLEEQVKQVFASHRPGWAREVREGDVIVGGLNFGTGSSRPGVQLLRRLGIRALVAESVNDLFYRNCVNYALPVVECRGVTEMIREGDVVVDRGSACAPAPRPHLARVRWLQPRQAIVVRARRRWRSILPVPVLGRLSRYSTCRGYL